MFTSEKFVLGNKEHIDDKLEDEGYIKYIANGLRGARSIVKKWGTEI